MTTQTTNISFDKSSTRTRFSAFWSAIATGFAIYMERSSRQAEVAALEAKTDAELKALGLRRDEIVRYVFRDMFYI